MGFILQIAEVRKVVDSELGFVADGPCGKFEAKVSKGNTNQAIRVIVCQLQWVCQC